MARVPTVYLYPLPTQGSWGRGFAAYGVLCRACGAEWTAVAPVGTVGMQCPICGWYDADHRFEGEPHEMPNDGAWIAPMGLT